MGRGFFAYGLVGAMGVLEPTNQYYAATFCSVAGSVVSVSYFALYSASAELIKFLQSAELIPVNLVICPSEPL